MLNEHQFWDLIAQAKAAPGKSKDIPAWLEQRLSELSDYEINDFGAWLATFVGRSYDAKLWAAASIISGGLSPDGYFGFQGWLIAQGRAFYENALENPDSLADFEFPEMDFGNRPRVSLEKLFYVYIRAFNKKAGKPSLTPVETPPGYRPPAGSQPNPPAGTSMKSIHENVQHQLLAWLNDPVKLTATFPKLVQRFKLP